MSFDKLLIIVFLLLQGISESNMHQYMSPYVDIISRGSLTQGKQTMYLNRFDCTMLKGFFGEFRL